ncbi:MAG TPA: endonuclease/exonuclease/phosphatase family protein [Solirubrobacteraceae bacterium]|nr:endonuclease/exonuclease/phosphatase family protein [Solirubrobacteraceae bacterium]
MRHRLSTGVRARVLLCAFAAVAAALIPASAAQAGGGRHVSVLTRNIYLGTGLTNVVGAQTFPEFVQAVSQDWSNVVATDFPRRAKALATEIQLTHPDVVGLQEVSLWRDQLVSDTVQGVSTPNATNVVYDFLGILQGELASRGIPYTAVSTSVNADVEAPRINPASPDGFTDVRLTDRDVILVRSSLASKFSNPQNGHYAVQFTVPTLGGPVTFTRGWTSVDYAIGGGRKIRVFETHLETEDVPPVQVAQGAEALGIINSSPYPVVALGDYNSAADGSTTPTYANLIAGGLTDEWNAFQPLNPGYSCCENELLSNFPPTANERIDLILTKGSGWDVNLAVRTGVIPFRLSPAPIWASDHWGVFADLDVN